jgi:hypothetical protein
MNAELFKLKKKKNKIMEKNGEFKQIFSIAAQTHVHLKVFVV